MESQPAVLDRKQPFYRRDPYTSIFLVLAVFFASQIIAGSLLTIYPSLKNWTAEQGSAWLSTSVFAQFFYIVVAETIAVWLIFKLLERRRIAPKKIGITWPVVRDIAYALMGYVVYFIAYLLIIAIAQTLSRAINVDQPQEIGFDGAYGSQLLFVFLSLVVLPPIAEEIMFRGFLFTSFRQKYGFLVSAIMTSVLFGIAHLQFGSGAPLLWVAAIDTFILSLVLCYLREKSGSLWPSVLLHAIKNGVAFVVLFHAKF